MSTPRLERLNGWLERRDGAIFLLLAVAHLVPLWTFTYFPSLDGPAHLAIADMLVRYDDPASAPIREFFKLNIGLAPTSLIFALLYGFMQVAPPLIAEKLLLSLYVIALPLALRYALAGLAAEALPLSLIGFLLIYNFPLHLGFYNFSFGLVIFLLIMGFWLRRRERADVSTVAGYLGLSLLGYFTHPFALAGSCVAIALTTVGELALPPRPAEGVGRRLRTMALLPALGFVPAALLAARFAFGQRGNPLGAGVASLDWPLWPRVQELLASASLASHASAEVLVAKAFSYLLLVLMGLVVARKREGGRRADGLFVAVLGFLALYLTLPDLFFDRWMPQRVMLYLLLAVALWLGAQAPTALPGRAALVRPVIVIAVLGIAAAGLAVRSTKYAELNRDLREYTSAAAQVTPGATVLSLRLSPLIAGELVSQRVDLFLQAGAYVAMERQAVDLRNFQAATGYFPLAYRPAVDPFRHLASDREFNRVPPAVDLSRYRARTGKTIDYVLLWGADDYLAPTAAGERARAVLEEVRYWRPGEYSRALERYRLLTDRLDDDYALVFTSKDRGLARLYRRKDGGKGSPAPEPSQ